MRERSLKWWIRLWQSRRIEAAIDAAVVEMERRQMSEEIEEPYYPAGYGNMRRRY